MAREKRSVRALKTYVDTKFSNSAMINGASIKDDSSNELIKFAKVTSSVNEVSVSNASTGNDPIISATGTNDNVGLTIRQKAAAPITLGTTGCTGVKLGVDQPVLDSAANELIKFHKVTDAVNEVTVTNAATGDGPSLSATGETNVPITLKGKGTGAVLLGQATSVGVDLVADQPIRDSAANELIKFVKTTDAVNEITVTNAAAGNGPIVSATGETNVPITVKGKGTGAVNLGQATSVGVDLVADQPIRDSSANEFIKFTKAATAVNEITVTNAAANGTPTVSATGGDTDIDLTLAAKGAGKVAIAALNPTFGVSAHDYAGAAVDWTLSAAELKCAIVTASNANGAVNAIATPTAGKIYIVANSTGQALTFKASGQSGIVVASTKTAILRGNGTDFVRVTADA